MFRNYWEVKWSDTRVTYVSKPFGLVLVDVAPTISLKKIGVPDFVTFGPVILKLGPEVSPTKTSGMF